MYSYRSILCSIHMKILMGNLTGEMTPSPYTIIVNFDLRINVGQINSLMNVVVLFCFGFFFVCLFVLFCFRLITEDIALTKQILYSPSTRAIFGLGSRISPILYLKLYKSLTREG